MTTRTDDALDETAETAGAAQRVMMLVDADNVSADVIEQAMAEVLERHGAIHVRRAYCTVETAVKQARLFERLALRPMVNLTAGKNANDIALAVDAMDLAVAERPDVAVIVSSDSDFAPLAIRLREKGCRVEGFGQTGKTAPRDKPAYDDFTDLSHRRAAAAGRSAAAAPKAPGKTAPRSSARPSARSSAKSPAHEAAKDAPKDATPAATQESAGSSSARKTSSRAAARPAPTREAAAALPIEVEQILNAVPSLREGRELELGNVAERLRAAGLLGKNAASTRLFGRHKSHFVLVPEGKPNRVRFLAAHA